MMVVAPLISKDPITTSNHILFAASLMSLSIKSLFLAGALLASTVTSQVVPGLTGTWTTKSRKVITGPVGTLQHSLEGAACGRGGWRNQGFWFSKG